MTSISLTVNGSDVCLDVGASARLVDTLRGHLGLHGSKPACRQGGCGACTVLVDGEAVYSCLTYSSSLDGADVETIEGIRDTDVGRRLVGAFADADALQCGACTPGQIVSAAVLLRSRTGGEASTELLDRQTVVEQLVGNLCRCGCYNAIGDAVLAADADGR